MIDVRLKGHRCKTNAGGARISRKFERGKPRTSALMIKRSNIAQTEAKRVLSQANSQPRANQRVQHTRHRDGTNAGGSKATRKCNELILTSAKLHHQRWDLSIVCRRGRGQVHQHGHTAHGQNMGLQIKADPFSRGVAVYALSGSW